jgi:hypothetical protein
MINIYKVAIDYDGVISANYQHYFQLSADFMRNGIAVYVLSAAKESRQENILEELDRLNFPCLEKIFRPVDFVSTPFNIGTWKKIKLIEYDIDLFFDNDIKQYEQSGVTFNDIETQLVRI